MPLKRTRYFRQSDTFTANTTWREKLDVGGFVTGIWLEVTGTPVSGASLSTEATWLSDFLGKVEVSAGGARPIISVDWNDLVYFNYLDQGKHGPTWKRNYATLLQREMAFIPFGRHIWDTEFGLDMSKWDNVFLNITNSATSTYYTGNLSLNVLLCQMDELTSGFPRGYLRKEEFKKWTTVSAGWEYSDLPSAYPFRGIHLQCKPDVDANMVAEASFQNLAYDTQFGYMGRQKFLHQGQLWHKLWVDYMTQPGLPVTSMQPDKTADYGFDTGIGYTFGAADLAGSADGAAASAIPTEGTGLNLPTLKLEGREADNVPNILAIGAGVQDFFTLHYNKEADPAWLLDPSRHGQITLDVQTRSGAAYADGTNRIVIDQVCPHPVNGGA